MEAIQYFFGDPRVQQAAVAGLIVAVIGFGLLYLLHRNNPLRSVLGKGTWPARDRSIAASLPMRWFGLSKWQSGVLGPVDRGSKVPPYAGLHVLSVSQERAILRVGGDVISGRWTLIMAVLFPVYAAVIFVQLAPIARFLAKGKTCISYVKEGSEFVREDVDLAPTFFNFFAKETCRFNLVFGEASIYDGLASKIYNYLNMDQIAFFLLFLIPLFYLWLTLRRLPAPLVFDRMRGLVYTKRRGALWAMAWPDVDFIAANAPFVTMPAFALQKVGSDGQPTGQRRWFALAAYHGIGEVGAPHLKDVGVHWIDRWDGMRCWVVAFMENGPDHIHGPLRGKSFVKTFIAPREGRVPQQTTFPDMASTTRIMPEPNLTRMLQNPPDIMEDDVTGLTTKGSQ